MRRARVVVVVTALALPMLLTGPAVAGPEPLSKKEFLKEANAICAVADAEADLLINETFAAYDDFDDVPPEVLEGFGLGVVAILRQMLAEIDALEPPTKDAKRVQKIIDAYTEVVEEIEADPAGFTERSNAGEDFFEKPDKLARKYGLKKCAPA